MKKYLMTVLIFMFGSLHVVTAQTPVEKNPSPQWWLNSALADTMNQCLIHVEGDYNYTKMTGATAGEIQSGSVKVAIRKDIFTHQTEYMIDKMNMMLLSFGMNYTTESHAFSDYLNVDITRLFYSEVGFIWERDNSLYLQNRYSLYAGAGVNGLIFEKHYLKMMVALGRINQNYSVPVDGIDVVKGAYAAFYLRQTYKYVIDQRFSIREQAYFLANMTDTDRYRMNISLNFDISIIQPVSLVLGYSYRFDKESELLGAIAENTKQTIGFKVSL